ncbi:MAG TPA: hypothetical protein VE954_04935 [Oligoflexus sp.]|uniref:hypothetical protein n=1 Tax=Oligoflexus sp. TaxID=1971216 RepID=UPI002D5B88CE|nr:hypothetical protein [Oligoflexus sp.]HYX32437.1 hypothetical protein [Oligoflexus sp.]
MAKALEPAKKDDADCLDSLADLEDSTMSNRQPARVQIVARQNPHDAETRLEKIEVQVDGKLKATFTQGIELILATEYKLAHGQTLLIQIGPVHIKVMGSPEGNQLMMDGVQINLKSKKPA